LGQRQGLGIGGSSQGDGQPWYVADKDLDNNVLIVTQGHDHPALLSTTLLGTDVHWIAHTPDTLPYKCVAKTRYRQSDQVCTIVKLDEHRCTVEFDQPQRSVTPGQSVVFYQGDECLGGAIIDKAFN